MLLAVYGTLRKGDYNHERFLGMYEPAVTERIDGFELYNMGGSYPYIARGADSITAEVYDIPLEVLAPIEDMERGAGYDMVKCKTTLGMADIFCMSEMRHAEHQSLGRYPRVLSGDWFEWLRKYKPERLGINIINIGG